MGLEFLTRVRRSSIGLGLIAALVSATYASPWIGLAVALGAGWSLVNLSLIERLVVTLTSPERHTVASTRRASVAVGGMLLLFTAGAGLLRWLDPTALLAGFLLPLAAIVLKAASLLLLPSRAWKTVLASPWRATAAVGLMVLGSWWAIGAMASGGDSSHASATGAAHVDDTTGGHGTAPTGHAGTPTAGAHAAEGHAEGGHAEAGPQKFPNVITLITNLAPDSGWAHFLHHYEPVIFSLFIGLVLCLLAFLASRNPQMIPSGLQNVAELVVEKLYDFVVGILGPKYGPRFVPFLGTLFVYIFAMNAFGLILFMDSPTSNLNVTFALGLTVFVYVQYIGIRNLGPIGYIDHLLGQPRNFVGWVLTPLMLPIHVLGELAKPISLSCRLFGNIFGEDMLLVAFATLGITMLGFLHTPFGVPLHAIFFPLVLLTSALQALVFTVLSAIYFLLMLPHDEHEHEAEAQHAH